jgi:hypothetical protein
MRKNSVYSHHYTASLQTELDMDKEFVKNIQPPLLEATPQAVISELAKTFQLETQSIRKILRGEWSRPDVVAEAFRLLEARFTVIGKVLQQREAQQKIPPSATAAGRDFSYA